MRSARRLALREDEPFAWFNAEVDAVDDILAWCKAEYGVTWVEVVSVEDDPYDMREEAVAICYYHDAVFRVHKGVPAISFMMRWC